MSAPDAGSQQAPPRDLKALTRPQLMHLLTDEIGVAKYRASQVFQWLHKKRVRKFAEMTNIPATLRERLGDQLTLGNLELDAVRLSKDGTRKLLLRTHDGMRIESVIIPMEDRLTQCVSSQVGCKIGCDFCLTGRMTTRRNLRASEIVDQVYWANHVMNEGERISNIVYMGMGEPLDNLDEVTRSIQILLDEQGQNLSGRRITVSTSGIAPKIGALGAAVPVNLAVSLNATTDETRTRLIPINKVWNIATLMQALRSFPLAPRRRITVEYVMLRGVNDTVEDARRLVKLLRGLRCKVNLIPFNPWPGAPYDRPSESAVNAFGAVVRDHHFTVTVRYSKGEDIGAACGQLDGTVDG
jgi:23S rRNA (adenine2503-C2)-methyltransferase